MQVRQRLELSPSLPTDLKYSNRIQVMDAFLGGSKLSASDIAAQIGLSRQTVMKSIAFFLESGLLVSAGKGGSTSSGGKRPELYELSRDRYFLCMTLWPRELGVRLYTIGGETVDELALSAALPENARDAVDNAGKLALQMLEKNGVELENVCGVSLSTSGTVDYKAGVLKYSSQSPEWGTNIPLEEYLRPYFLPGTIIFIENAGKMTARPFLMEPELSGKRVMVIFTTWGLASSFIENGSILNGPNSLIGEIGHMVVDPHDPELCGCGSHGCLERLVSRERIWSMALKLREKFPDSALWDMEENGFDIPELFRLPQTGDSAAGELTGYLASCFAVALRNITLVFDPDLIVFQGDYAYADESFDAALRRELAQFRYFPEPGPFEIRYDRRPLSEMNARGSYIALAHQYFALPSLYMETI